MVLAEEYIKFCAQYVVENNYDDIEYFQAEQVRRAKEEKKSEPAIKLLQNLTNVLNATFQKITYADAVELCIQVFFLRENFYLNKIA